MNTQRTIKLTPPRIATDHIKEKIVCIRSHRERIFRVSCEISDAKLICHNYGQGGAGWTFLFGCVNESIRLFEEQLSKNDLYKDKPISVIGAGCYGLLTAITLSRKGYSVTIVSGATEDLQSDKAAGFFFPRARKSSTPCERMVFETLGMESYETYLQIAQNTHPFIKKGPQLLPSYFALDIDPEFSTYIAKGLICQPERVTIDFCTGKSYEAMEYKTIFINPSVIMHELRSAITTLPITIQKREIGTFNDISDSIIFNCAGLNAKQLTNDPRLVPVQGHLITLKNQPPMEQLQYLLNFKVVQVNSAGKPRDELIYFAPKESGILGITFIRGQDSISAGMHEFDRLLQRCKDFFGTE